MLLISIRNIKFTIQIYAINTIESQGYEIDESRCMTSITQGLAGTNAVVVCFAVLELPQSTYHKIGLVANLHVGINQLCILVRQECFLRPKSKKKGTTSEEGLVISLETRRNERKNAVQKVAFAARPL